MVGPLPPPIGGTTVLFQQLAQGLADRRDIALITINTSRSSAGMKASLRQAMHVLVQILKNAARADIIAFHASIRGGILFAGVVRMVSMACRRKWIFRGFGGDFDLWYEHASGLQRLLFRVTVLKAQSVLLETRSSVQYFARISRGSIQWYANSRPLAPSVDSHTNGSPARHFVYIGHVKPSKGIFELLQAAEKMPETVVVDIYGPLSDGLTEEIFHGKKAHYCGVLQPGQVGTVMARYDVLVLPTYFEGEGYPGVILEAYAAGIPVIATRWRSIPEIVDTQCGILVDPKDVTQLAEAMNALASSTSIMERLRAGVYHKAKAFSSEVWTDKFIEILRNLPRNGSDDRVNRLRT